MKKIWFALLFFAGGLSHELRNPVQCQCIVSNTTGTRPRRDRR